MKQLVPLVVAAAILCSLGAVDVTGEQGVRREDERGGFPVAGRRIPFASTERTGFSPPGRIENFCSARMIYDLLTARDTLWIGTEGGLFAYCISRDSVTAVRLPLTGSIEALAMDDGGSLWVGGRNGLGIRSGSGWRSYTDGESPFYSRVMDISPGEGGMWLATFGQGAGLVDRNHLTIYTRADSLLDDRVVRILEHGRETVWFGTASGICRADTARWESMRYGSRFPIGSVNDMLIDEGGSLFVAIARGGVAVYNLGRVQAYDLGRGLPERDVSGFSLDPLGKTWAAGHSGVSTFDGSSWTPYRLPGVPMGRYGFLSIHHGIDGECYLGTDEGRVLVLGQGTIKEVDLPQSFPEQTVTRLRMFGRSLWAVGIDRLYRLGGKGDIIPPPAPHFRGTMTDVWADREGEEIWVSTRFGLLHRKGAAWEVFDRRQGLPTERFSRIARDGEGNLWFGTFDRGILKLAGGTWEHYSDDSGLPDVRVEDLLVDRHGGCWALMGNGLIARFRDERWVEVPLPEVEGRTVPEPDTTRAYEPFVRFISPADEGHAPGNGSRATVLGMDGIGNCMVGGDRGVYRFTGTDWQVIEPPAGSSFARATALLGTSRGTVWVGTDGNGLFVRDGGGWERIGIEQGLSDDHIESLCEDSSGNIWIGTRSGGLSRFSPGPARDGGGG